MQTPRGRPQQQQHRRRQLPGHPSSRGAGRGSCGAWVMMASVSRGWRAGCSPRGHWAGRLKAAAKSMPFSGGLRRVGAAAQQVWRAPDTGLRSRLLAPKWKLLLRCGKLHAKELVHISPACEGSTKAQASRVRSIARSPLLPPLLQDFRARLRCRRPRNHCATTWSSTRAGLGGATSPAGMRATTTLFQAVDETVHQSSSSLTCPRRRKWAG